MGWSDSHLNRFHIHVTALRTREVLTFSDDPDRVPLAQLGFRLRERFLYEYDFYDNLEYDVRLEKVLPLNPKRTFPICTGGHTPQAVVTTGVPWVVGIGRRASDGTDDLTGFADPSERDLLLSLREICGSISSRGRPAY